MLELYRKKAQDHLGKGNYYSYQTDLMRLADLCVAFSQCEKALALYEEVAFWQLSGLENSGQEFKIGVIDWFPYEESFLKIDSPVIHKIQTCKVMLIMKDEDFLAFTRNVIESLESPFHVFTKEEAFTILVSELNGDTQELTEIYEHAKQRLLQKDSEFSSIIERWNEIRNRATHGESSENDPDIISNVDQSGMSCDDIETDEGLEMQTLEEDSEDEEESREFDDIDYMADLELDDIDEDF